MPTSMTPVAAWPVALLLSCLAASPAFAAEPGRPASRILESGEQVAVVTDAAGREWAQFGDVLLPLDGDRVDATGGGASWPGGLVYFEFDASVGATHRQSFLDYVGVWSAASAVQFFESAAAPNRILVQEVPDAVAQGCGASPVGIVGGVQNLFITDTCWSRAVVVHEMGHALGLVHEQVRGDRDQFVTVSDPDNMQAQCPGSFTVNWGIQPAAPTYTAYDFASVMHYPRIGCLQCVPNQPSLCVTLNALQGQPAGEPAGSASACSNAISCNALMGSGTDASARDRLGMAIRYGQRLTYAVTGDGSGTVTFVGSTGSCGDSCVIAPFGGTLSIVATPNAGSLAYISGACSGSGSCNTSMTQNRTAIVRFVKVASLLSVVGMAGPSSRPAEIFANGFE
jgi:hypothetical protein